MAATSEPDKVDLMRQSCAYARQSIPVETAYCVGCVIVKDGEIISTGFSRELPGNTHAEECALAKLAERGVDPAGCDLYSTMEPCSVRLSGNTPCCPRIIDARIKRVFVGAMEPARFVECEGVRQLQDAGIEVIRVEADGLIQECLAPNAHIPGVGAPASAVAAAASTTASEVDVAASEVDATSCWRRMQPSDIPTKPRLHRAFEAALIPPAHAYERHNTAVLVDAVRAGARGAEEASRGAAEATRRVLDLGCGEGHIAEMLARNGLDVVGVDINDAAIVAATERAAAAPSAPTNLRFVTADCLLLDLLSEPRFDVVLVQLVISVVGGPMARQQLLRVAHSHLRRGGTLLLSASGVSADINRGYATLYAQDAERTGERNSYLSRDAAGAVLYPTHHFEFDELMELLRESGFEVNGLHKEREASSRRPDEAAWFLYAVATAAAANATESKTRM